MKKIILLFGIALNTLFLNAQWEQSKNPVYLAPAYDFALDGTNILVATYTQGVLVSTNSGGCFSKINPGNPDVSAVAICGTTFLAGTRIGAGTGAVGVYTSNDGGLTWTYSSNGIPANTSVLSFAVNGTDIFAATSIGVFKSTDNGVTWEHALFSTGHTDEIVTNGTFIFTSSISDGIVRMNYNGANKTQINNGLPVKSYKILINGSTIYASSDSGGLYKSVDNGDSWTTVISTGLTNSSINALLMVGTTLFASTNGGGNGGVYKLTNGATSWTLASPCNSSMGLGLSGTTIYTTCGSDVYKSTNEGTNWTKLSSADPTSGINSLTTNGNTIFAGGYGKLYVSTSAGNCWTSTNVPLGGTINALHVNSNNVLFVGAYQNAHISSDNGNNWWTGTSGLNTQVQTFASNGGLVFFGTEGEGIYKYITPNWQPSSSGLPANSKVKALVFNGSNVVAGTDNGVYKSINNGTSWSVVNTTLTNIKALIVSGTTIFAGTNSGVYKSTNNGTSWTATNTGLTNLDVTCLASSGTNLFAGTNGGGVFMSADNGANWFEINTGLTSNSIVSLAVNSTYLYCSGTTIGVWRRPLIEVLVPNQPETPTVENSICQNSPAVFSTTGSSNATSYIWSVSPTNAGTITETGLSATVTWNSSFSGIASITVQGKNSYGTGLSSTNTVVVQKTSSSSLSIETACDSYTWNGQTYSTSGPYTHTLQNAVGCDSIITLHLTVNAPSLTQNETICQGETFTFFGQNLTETGTYTHTLQNSNGCDSTITLSLNVSSATPTISQVDGNLVTQTSASYQWFLNGSPISGATSKTYTPTQDGDYTVQVTNNNGCTGTSAVFTVGGVGIAELEKQAFVLFPNPATNSVTVSANETIQTATISDVFGKVVLRHQNNGTSSVILPLSDISSGVYFVRVETERGIGVKKLVVE